MRSRVWYQESLPGLAGTRSTFGKRFRCHWPPERERLSPNSRLTIIGSLLWRAEQLELDLLFPLTERLSWEVLGLTLRLKLSLLSSSSSSPLENGFFMISIVDSEGDTCSLNSMEKPREERASPLTLR